MLTMSQAATVNQSASSARRSLLLLWAWGARAMRSVYRRRRRLAKPRGAPARHGPLPRPGRSLLRRSWLGACVILAHLALAVPARAAFDVDVYRGPLMASSRVTAMGGAFAGVAEGLDGVLVNPAALASRVSHSASWFDYDLALDWDFSTEPTDLDGDGRRTAGGTTLGTVRAGFALAFGRLGLGLIVAPWSYELPLDPADPAAGTLEVSAFDFLLGGAYAWGDGAWVAGVGVGVRGLTVGDIDASHHRTELSYGGAALDLGLLWRPPGRSWRLGGSARLPVSSVAETPAAEIAGRAAPSRAVFPPQVRVGFSWFHAADPARRYNVPLPEDDWGDAPRFDDRRYVVLAVDIGVVGREDGARSLEAWVAGEDRRAGHFVGLTWNLGAEAEVWHDRLKLRGGLYGEPLRVGSWPDGLWGRPHLTGGFELRLFDLWIWRLKLGASFDVAARYDTFTLGFGLWH